MKNHTLSQLFNGALLLILVLGAVLPASPALAQEPDPGGSPQDELITSGTPELASSQLYPADMDPPETCGIPGNAPFGQDVEVFLGPLYDNRSYSLDQSPSWGPTERMYDYMSAPVPRNTAAVATGPDEIVAVWKAEGQYALRFSTWSAGGGWADPHYSGPYPRPTAKGNPALLSRHPRHWAVFLRDDNNKIQLTQVEDGSGSPWQTVPGSYSANSDPAVVSKDPQHMAVFFTKSNGTAWFSEWQSSVGWRDEPVSLGKPAGTQFSSPLSAISRNEDHIAVFGMTEDNKLWVREWTSQNESDWSDTQWVYVMDGYSSFKPAVVSRHNNHIGVAVLAYFSGLGVGARYKEWTYQSGWDPLINMPLSLTQFWGPLSFAATSTDEMWLFGVSEDGCLQRNKWIEGQGWRGWRCVEGGWSSDVTLSAAVRRPHDIMLVGSGPTSELTSKHYSADGRPLTAAPDQVVYGLPRGQAMARVDGRTLGISVRRTDTGKWRLIAWDPANGSKAGQDLNHADSGQTDGQVSVAAGDLDYDGDDEIVVATLNSSGEKIDISTVDLGCYPLPYADLTLINMQVSKTSRSLYHGEDVNAAIGDLDGDGREDDVVVGYLLYDVKTLVYQNPYTGTVSLEFRGEKDVYGGSGDLEIAIGKVTHRHEGEQLVVSRGGSYYNLPWVNVVSWQGNHWDAIKYDDFPILYFYGGDRAATGDYSTALRTGDVDADGLEEIIYTRGGRLYVADGEGAGRYWDRGVMWYDIDGEAADRSLAVGDLNWDGKAEIVHATGSGDGAVQIVAKTDDGRLIGVGETTAKGVALVADLDDDSHEADLVGCNDFTDVSVIAVVNGAPRWYGAHDDCPEGEATCPIHRSGGGYGTSSSATESREDGTTTKLGGSLTVGTEVDVNIPIICLNIAKIRASYTAEFMYHTGTSEVERSCVTDKSGYNFGGWGSAYSRGMVIYTRTGYRCYYYDVYKPEAPADTSRMMTCTPSSDPRETNTSLERWHSDAFKAELGDGWVENLGRSDNDVNNYPSSLSEAVDPFRVRWHDPSDQTKYVHDEILDGNFSSWSLEQSTGGEQIKSNSWELNQTSSVGATISGVKIDTSFTGGYGKQWSRSVGWEEGLTIEGHVEHFLDSMCPTCQAYEVVPYVYRDTAVTRAGETYPYLVADYYVPCIEPYCAGSAKAEAVADSQGVVGVAPQTPVITSTTHPDPNTWYPTSTVAFEWDQPAGDPAAVTGYRWNVDYNEAITPTTLHTVLTTTHTYTDVADGLYYLHLQAKADGSDYGPVAHRAFRVDTNPPQVDFAFDPPVPTGFGGWYNTPVTVTVNATDTAGSGVTAVEYRVDSGAWQAYTAPITFLTDTVTTTLWARATDDVGYVSDPVSTTLKIDVTPPSSYDADGHRLTYASVITDEVGNAQLVLGGALSDTLSGRLMMEVKGSDLAPWRRVSAVGEFPIPPDNDLVTTNTVSLNWIYTPTYEIRGVYPLRGRGVDQAGNYEQFGDEDLEIFGVFWWEPDAAPELTESQVSVAPGEVYPGDVVTFTLGVRNTGYQESRVALTDTVPAELTVLTDTISGGGRYDPGTGVITWAFHALWPGQTRYLFFSAQVDEGLAPTEPLTLENRLDVLGHWPWGEELPEIQPYLPPAPPSYAEVATTTVTVLTGTVTTGLGDAAARKGGGTPPAIWAADVVEGEVVDDPLVTLFVEASPDADFLYVKEWVWDTVSDTWALEQESGWVPFEEGDGLAVSESGFSKQGRYQWMLSQGDGVKYLGVWVADGEQQTTNLNDANLIYTNLMGTGGQAVAAGERVQYRVPLRANDLALLNLVTLSGDADLYVWKPRFAFRPHHLSNGEGSGFHLDTVGFFAGEEGVHVVEVEAASEGTVYRLATGGDVVGAGLLAETEAELTRADVRILEAQDAAMRDAYQALPRGVQMAQGEKERPAHPLSLSTPYGVEGAEVLPEVPEVPGEAQAVYLPLVLRSE